MESIKSKTESPYNEIHGIVKAPRLISQDDLFKVLKKRYHQTFKANSGVKKRLYGVFYETICMLESLEIGLTKIHSGNYPTRDDYITAKNSKKTDTALDIVNFTGA